MFEEVHFERPVEGQFELDMSALADKMVAGLYSPDGENVDISYGM